MNTYGIKFNKTIKMRGKEVSFTVEIGARLILGLIHVGLAAHFGSHPPIDLFLVLIYS